MGWILSLAVLALVAMTPLSLSVSLEDGGWQMLLRCWWIPIWRSGRPRKEKKEGPNKPARQKKPAGKEKEHLSAGFEKTAHAFIGLLHALKRPARFFSRHMTVRGLRLEWRIARGDAAETGIAYGRSQAYIPAAYGVLTHVFRLRGTALRVWPDFLQDEDDVRFSCRFTTCFWALAGAVAVGGVAIVRFMVTLDPAGKQDWAAKRRYGAAAPAGKGEGK